MCYQGIIALHSELMWWEVGGKKDFKTEKEGFHLLRTNGVSFQTNSFWLAKPVVSEDKDHEMLALLGQNASHISHECVHLFFK